MSKQNAPFVVRWRNGVMDDPNPALSWRALAAAMALTRYADVKTGHNCFPGASKCARNMRVSTDTIERGWAELKEAGWLDTRSRGEGVTGLASLKVLRWPARREPPADSGSEANHPPTAGTPPADSGTTFPGTGEPFGPSRPSGVNGESGEIGEPQGRPEWLACGRCDHTRRELRSGLCEQCTGEVGLLWRDE